MAEERATIARELHDVVAHAISVTVLQSRGARRQLGRDEEQVRRALDAIEHTNTQALGDMRRLLAVLRDTEGDAATTPQPSLARLDDLVADVRESGLDVELVEVGEDRDVPPGVDLSAYRIVQEALTNVLKHAAAGRATVRLDYGADELRLSSATTASAPRPRTAPATVSSGSGNGSRSSAARSRPARPTGGGFEVSARLPYSVEVIVAIRVVIADDQPLVRAGLRMILDTEADVVVAGEAANGAEAVDLCERERPDVVLMDVRMPVMDGIEATRLITAVDEPPRVLVLTTFDLDEVVYDALRAGASGFLLKDAPEERLTTAIKVVAEGGSLFAPSVTKRLIEEFAKRRDAPGVSLDDLTEREAEVLRLVARGLQQHRDRRRAVHHREHREDPRRPGPDEARPARPRPGGRAGLRVRHGPAGRRIVHSG